MKIHVFGVTLLFVNLLAKPRMFYRFSGKYIILYILKGEMPFKMLSRKKNENIGVLTLLNFFRPVTRNAVIPYLA